MGQPAKQHSQLGQHQNQNLKQIRVAGRVGAAALDEPASTSIYSEVASTNDILRLYTQLRELHDRESSELCKAIDYSLKIFGNVPTDSVTPDGFFQRFLAKK